MSPQGSERPEGAERPPINGPVRYRCTLCGNLTRFDVVERKRTRSFYHFTLGGLLSVDEEEVLDSAVEEVVCRWCNSSANVEEIEVGPD